jgi:hypothetical protein
MTASELIKILEVLSPQHTVLVDAKGTTLEIDRAISMASTVMLVADKTSYENRNKAS